MIKKKLWLSVLLSITFLLIGFSNLEAKKEPLTVYFLDIGQGDSTVITTPAGKTILIDGGMGGSMYKKKDKGKTVIIPFLKEKGIKKLDMMIMTHADFDHIGGLVYLLENTKKDSKYPIEIKEFLDPGHPHVTYLYQDLLNAVKARPEIKYRQSKRGEFLDWGKGVTAEVVGPDHIYSDANNSSIVIKLTYGSISFMLTGDAAEKAERDMVTNYGRRLKSQILKAGHHGSAHSSGTPFLNCVKPEVVTISVGERNKHKLPFKEALDRLNATGAKMYRTDYQGTITVTTDGKTYEVVTERKAPPLEERWDYIPVLTEEEKLDINTASAAELETLPMIGPSKAQGIIDHRPYEKVDDLLEKVPGIGTKIVERLRPFVTVGKGKVVFVKKPLVPKMKININTASSADLQRLSGVRSSTAQRIIAGRPYAKVDDLTKVKGIGAKTLEKWRSLIIVEGPTEIAGRPKPGEKKPIAPEKMVNINTASSAQLQRSLGVKPDKAQAIIDGRPYASIDKITKVRGIGAKTLEKWRDLITVE